HYGTRIVLEIIGQSPPGDLQEVVDWFSDTLLPYEESLELLRSRGWDIGLAPLANTPFNAAKQATKFRDYAWAGAAIVCSKVPTYERSLLHGIHCLLVDNTATAWEEAIASLIDDLSQANFLRQGAKQLLEAVHTQEITNATWLQLIWRIGVTEAGESFPS